MNRGKYAYVVLWVKYALNKFAAFLKSHPVRKENLEKGE